jgi:ATP-binding cassette subfamily B protein
VVVLITIPIIFTGTLLIGKHMRKAYSSVREKVGKLNSGVEDNISGIRVVQAISQESGNIRTFEKLNKDNLAAHIKAVLVSAIFFPFMSMTGTLGTALVVLAGGLMIINGESGATIGLVMAFMGYANRFFMPLRDLSQIYSVYQNAAASAERIHVLFNEKPKISSPSEPSHLPVPLQGRIAVRDVSFAYNPSQPVLEHVDAIFEAGKTTAVVGPTGAGKSTLIKLIARLYDVDSGSISIDETDIRSVALPELRQTIMLVPQDVFLFDGNILDNIRYGDPTANDETIIAAAVNACADPFIRTLPEGYQTQVGEGGVRLSGGQRQLIAFARAVLADRPILILDEATSSVDAATEQLMQQALERLLPGRTAIIVAHRFTTLRRAERILVLDQGQKAGFDSHENLLERCPLYQALYEKQWLGTATEPSKEIV